MAPYLLAVGAVDHLGCDFFSPNTNTQIYKRSLWNGSHRMVSSVYLFFLCGLIGDMGHTNVQMRKCTNSCSRLIDLLNKI